MIIGSFNIQNLRLHTRDRLARGKRSAWLSGAHDLHVEPGILSRPTDAEDRDLTAEIIHDMDADVLALQEVFDIGTLDHFHAAHIAQPAAFRRYPYRICLPGNDGRGQDVALLSRHPPRLIESHAGLTLADCDFPVPDWMSAGRSVFCRDCLRVTVGAITLYVIHFKANYPDPAQSRDIRSVEARMARRIIETDFDDPATGLWMILGDFNDSDRSGDGPLAPLTTGFATDLMARLPDGARWTYRDPDTGRRFRPDSLLASPALAARWPEAVPKVYRDGLDTGHPRASDHAAISIELEGLDFL
jgi:endonuclease/exonuclease/phosphatase family metal-dependent hydrolase